MKRRELFSSLASSFSKNTKQESVIRPPYFLDENDFFQNCISCENKECEIACSEDISVIVILEDGTPALNFSKSGCTYCDNCALSCPKDVLKIENKANIQARFTIDLLKCLSWNDTMCYSCKDPCMVDAIKFLGLFRAEIDNNICNGCGFCLSVCPTNAILFNTNLQKE
jgi:ferredoxin-type protein NapF